MADDAWRPQEGSSREVPAKGSAARRILWAVLGAGAYTVAYLAAKHFLGF